MIAHLMAVRKAKIKMAGHENVIKTPMKYLPQKEDYKMGETRRSSGLRCIRNHEIGMDLEEETFPIQTQRSAGCLQEEEGGRKGGKEESKREIDSGSDAMCLRLH